MNDFLIALAVAAGGGYAMSYMDQRQVLAAQGQSCATQGGSWVETTANGGTFGTCTKGGQPITTTYNQWGVVPDLGIPLIAALLLTRSLPGMFGAVLGVGALFLMGASGIH